MADENINQASSEAAPDNTGSRAQERITELSSKVEQTAKERDERDRLLKESNDKLAALEKENTFNSGFADILGTQPAAREHKDEIKEKVLAGYSVEDATFAVLGKAGKLGAASAPAPQVAGGSATTTVTAQQKEVKDMTLAEKREVLAKELMWQ